MENSPEKYIPISCNFYDHLESFATFGKKVKIEYQDEVGEEVMVEGIIKDFKIFDEIEYLILDNGNSIRLDRLISAGGLVLKDFHR